MILNMCVGAGVVASARWSNGAGPLSFLRLIIDISTPRQEADAILGDLEEGFKKRARKQSRAYAQLWYASQAIRSIWPLLWAATKGLMSISAVTELLKRIQ